MRNVRSKMPDLKRSEEYLRNRAGIHESKITVTIACRWSRAIGGGRLASPIPDSAQADQCCSMRMR